MAQYPIVSMAEAAKKSLALIERRTRNFIDLYQSGRWKH